MSCIIVIVFKPEKLVLLPSKDIADFRSVNGDEFKPTQPLFLNSFIINLLYFEALVTLTSTFISAPKNCRLTTKMIYLCISSPRVTMVNSQHMVVMDKVFV